MLTDDTLFLQRFLRCQAFYPGRLDGLYGPMTDAAYHQFQKLTQGVADDLGRFDPRSELHITMLMIAAQRRARTFLRGVTTSHKVALQGLTVRLISSTRTYDEQAELYAQGRSKPGRVVTNAGAGESNHNFGIAWDVGVFSGTAYLDNELAYAALGDIGKSIGLYWGGDWKSIIDRPHFELGVVNCKSIKDVRTAFEAGQGFTFAC